MLISKIQAMDELDMMWDSEDECEELADHTILRERLRKTLYFGKTPTMDHTSLPMTELAVEYFQDAIPRELGKVDMYWASSFTRRASVSPCAMMLGMLYIERLRHKNPDYLKKMSSEELFLISMMLASKYLFDEGVTEEVYNDEWAASCNFDLEDINQLEMDFLSAIDWSLYVSEETFTDLLLCTERCIAMKEAYRRGYFTYSDLSLLLDSSKLALLSWKMFAEMFKVLAVCSFAYSMGACTMVASTMAVTSLQQSLITLPTVLMPTLVPVTTSSTKDTPISPCTDSMVLCENKTQGPDDQAETPKSDPHAFSGHVWDESPKPASLASRFLTLALVKDTLMAFVFGGHTQDNCSVTGSHCDGDSLGEPGEPQPHRSVPCTCPHCPRKASKSDKPHQHHVPLTCNQDSYPVKVPGVCHPSLWIQSHCASSSVDGGSGDGHTCGGCSGHTLPCVSVWEQVTSVLGSTQALVRPLIIY